MDSPSPPSDKMEDMKDDMVNNVTADSAVSNTKEVDHVEKHTDTNASTVEIRSKPSSTTTSTTDSNTTDSKSKSAVSMSTKIISNIKSRSATTSPVTSPTDSKIRAANTNSSRMSSSSASNMEESNSLSQYLHSKFQVLTNASSSAKDKMEMISNLNSMLTGTSQNTSVTHITCASPSDDPNTGTNTTDCSADKNMSIQSQLHAPALIDKYITLHPSSHIHSNMTNNNTPSSQPMTPNNRMGIMVTNNNNNRMIRTTIASSTPTRTKNPFSRLASPLTSSHSTSSSSSTTKSYRTSENVQGGIQIPPFSWQSNFRKGYSFMLWVRLHPPLATSDSSSGSDIQESCQDSINDDDPWSTTKKDTVKDPILFRFATCENKEYAHGVQASLLYYKPQPTTSTSTSNNNQETNTTTPPTKNTALNESSSTTTSTTTTTTTTNTATTTSTQFQLKIQTLGKQFTANRSDYKPLLITPPFTIRHDEWVLLGVQHSFPYLKRPFVTFSVNGVEIHRGEVAYPSYPTGADIGGVSGSGGGGSGLKSPNASSSRGGSSYGHSTTDEMNDNWLLRDFNTQSIDVASVGLYKDSIPNLLQGMVYEYGPCMEEGNVVGGVLPVVPPVVQSRDAVIMGGTPMTSSATSVGSGNNNGGSGGNSFLKQSSNTSASSGGRGIGIPLCSGVSLMDSMARSGDLLLQKTLSKFVWGIHASDAKIMGRSVVSGGIIGGGNMNSTTAATSTGGDKICIRLQGGLNLGNTVDVPKIGIVQPKAHVRSSSGASALSPFNRKSRGNSSNASSVIGGNGDGEEVTAKIIGLATLHHSTLEYLQLERQHTSLLDDGHQSIPNYQLPSISYDERPIPNFFSTYLSINPLSYILLSFHLALPPPGYSYSLQLEYYRDSFDHLYQLVVYHDGEYAAKLIELLATNLRLGGRMREEILQSGGIYTFTTLLRRVLLRASRLGMLRSSGSSSSRGMKTPQSLKRKKGIQYWQMYASRETPDDELCDITSHTKSAPMYIPPLITKACCLLIDACCGSAVADGVKGKRPPLGLNIRRTSDIALTAIFAFAFDVDLWGGDCVACASILQMVVDRYCCVYPMDFTSGKHELAFGWLLGGQITVQYLLDMIRLRFGNETIVSTKADCSTQCRRKIDAMASIATSYSAILYTMMKYSLSSASKSVTRSEHDIISAVAALSDCPLGSIGAHVVLTTLRNLLVYCEVIGRDSVDLPILTSTEHPSTIQTGHTPSRVIAVANTNAEEQNLKLKRVKSEIASRLVRNLLRGQFHDVIAPMLLSRTVFDGRRAMIETKSGQENIMIEANNEPSSTDTKLDVELGAAPSSGYSGSLAHDEEDGSNGSEKMKEFRWQHHWRISLLLFTWVASISGPEGEISAKSTGSLLFHSGKAGSLSGCLLGMSTEEESYFSTLLVPPLPTSTSAIIPGRQQNATLDVKEMQLNELRHRLRINLHTLCGLVGSLVFNGTRDRVSAMSTQEEEDSKPVINDETTSAISDLISVLTKAFRHLHNRGIHDSHSDNRRIRKEKAMNLMILAKEAVPPLLISAMILDDPIQELCHRTSPSEPIQSLGDTLETSSMDSFDLVGESSITTDSEMSWIEVTPLDKSGPVARTPEERLRLLRSCQDSLLHTSANLVLNAMVSGGGEASTLVWRTIISTVTSFCSKGSMENEGKETASETQNSAMLDSNSLANTVMCRMSALVFTEIFNRYGSLESQWTSVELCSATARLCDLVEEKNLLRFSSHSNKDEAEKTSLTLSQVHLICSLLDVMKSGRETKGWNQLTPSSHTSQVGSKNPIPTEENLAHLRETSNLLDTNKSEDESISDFTLSGLLRNENLPDQLDTQDSKITLPSKMLLPILQPCLRIMLNCIDQVRSKVTVFSGTKAEEDKADSSRNKKSLLPAIIKELQMSVTAAISGLEFSNARDICLNCISKLRKAISHHKEVDDSSAILLCCVLLLKVIHKMRSRYEEEKRKRQIAQHEAYDSPQRMRGNPPDPSSAEKSLSEAANASEVESLLIGNLLISSEDKDDQPAVSRDEGGDYGKVRRDSITSDDEDFVVFPHEQESSEHGRHATNKMGWSNYKGFKSALEKCIQAAPKEGEKSGNRQKDTENYCNHILNILSPFLDAWDQKQMEEADESEFIELFTEHSNISGSPPSHFTSPAAMSSMVSGSETAADSMSSYIELASSENSRICEIRTMLFPSRRKDCITFVEKHCWKIFMDLDVSCCFADGFFEYCAADGGRDYGGRLISSPIHPQFHRTIPRHFDHSSDSNSKPNDTEGKALDMGEIKTLLEKADLEIVDITKKQESDEDMSFDSEDDIDASGNVLVAKPSMDNFETDEEEDDEDDNDGEDDNSEPPYLGFPEKNDVEATDDSKPRSQRDDASSLTMLSMQNQSNNGYSSQHNFSMSSFANPPNSSAACLIRNHSNNVRDGGFPAVGGGHGTVELFYDNCLHVKAEGSRKGTLLLTATYLIFEYDETNGLLEGESLAIDEAKKRSTDDSSAAAAAEILERQYEKKSAIRPKSLRLNISELSHIYLRRYRLRDSALEMFFIPSGGSTTGGTGLLSALSSVFLDFGPGREGNEWRDDAAHAIMKRAPPQTVKQWPDHSRSFLQEQLRIVTIGWATGRLSNYDYLLSLNCLAGRSFNDLCQYPVMPWVLSNYTSEEIPNLHDKANYRDLTKPMGALNPTRLKDYIERFETFQDAMIPPFMYGSHYSTSAGVVLHFLVRSHPFASLHRQLQSGHFDVADRLFSSVARTWDMCTGVSAAEVKELTPEWYCNPSFLRNSNQMKLGTSQDGEVLDDVILPPWAKGSPERFVEVLRCAMESDVCSAMLPDWIDLIFGRKQQGPDAVEAHNVFFYLTYYGSVDVASIQDEDLRTSTELQIAHFGNTPMQLFFKHHVRKLPKSSSRRRQSFSDILRLYDIQSFLSSDKFPFNSDLEVQKPFQSAPLSHWVHLAAPPPGPHAPIIAVRLAGTDHCLAIDARGIFHCFRWAWRIDDPENNSDDEDDEDSSDEGLSKNDLFIDKGCFVAQRELHNFRSVPRLHYSPISNSKDPRKQNWTPVVLAISKSLFASRTVLLVLSDGDGKGSLCMQLVDPTKGVVKGQVIVPSIHSARISAIHMDPIGIAAGVGGVGGELAIVGSEDGTATLWRLISSQYLPLRPRLRFSGHGGARINSVAVSSALNMCVTVSDHRCCFFNLGNGSMIRSFSHPTGESAGIPEMDKSSVQCTTVFASANAVCICLSGYVVIVCISTYTSNDGEHLRDVVTLQLFSTEGVHIGSKALEPWRGIPTKVVSLSDGRAVMVCSGGGVSIHLISSILPLHFVDEWRMTEDSDGDNVMSAFDVDFGPSQLRPVVSVAGCSSGAVRFHALRGISEWSEENKKGSVTEAVGNAVGNALSKPAQRIRSLVGTVKGTGSRVVGVGKEIGREAISDVKIRGVSVSGFLFGNK